MVTCKHDDPAYIPSQVQQRFQQGKSLQRPSDKDLFALGEMIVDGVKNNTHHSPLAGTDFLRDKRRQTCASAMPQIPFVKEHRRMSCSSSVR